MPEDSKQRHMVPEDEIEARQQELKPVSKPALLFVNKTIESPNLSHSLGTERSRIFRHVQPRSKTNKSLQTSKKGATQLLPVRRNRTGGDEHGSQQPETLQQNRTSRSLARTSSIVVHDGFTVQYSPTNGNEQLSRQLILLLGGSKTPSLWLRYIPSYIEGDQTVALAATALVHARQAQLCGNPAEDMLGSRYYRKCLTLLQTSITASGGCLLTIALLALYEQSAMTSLRAWGTHVKALSALLLEGGRSHRLGELAPIFLYMTKGHRYLMPLAAGSSSPFEHKPWLDMHPISSTGMTADVKRLKMLSNKIFILLPRLVAGLRVLRGGDRSSLEAVDEINNLLRLAAHLQKLKDPLVEAAVLSHMTLENTTNPDDSSLIPFSYASNNFEAIFTLTGYWEAHLGIANACRVLRTIVENVSPGFMWQSNFSTIELEISKDQELLAVHILMSLGRFSTAMSSYIVFSAALFAVWRATTDRGGIFGLDEAAAKAWLLPKIALALNMPGNLCKVQVIDETCEMMVGGPLKGFWVDAFQRSNHSTQYEQ